MDDPPPSSSSGFAPQPNFAVEDTADGCYRDVVTVLQRKGWRKVGHRRRSKLEKKRLPSKDVPFFIWTINEKDIDFGEVDATPFQVCNHFEGMTNALATKQGFCDLLRDLHWAGGDAAEVSPRSYNLGDAVHRDEFIDDFKVRFLAQRQTCAHHQPASPSRAAPRSRPPSSCSSGLCASRRRCRRPRRPLSPLVLPPLPLSPPPPLPLLPLDRCPLPTIPSPPSAPPPPPQ